MSLKDDSFVIGWTAALIAACVGGIYVVIHFVVKLW